MTKQILQVLPVPWMVSPSVPGLNVCTWEGDDTYTAFNVSIIPDVDPGGILNDPNNPRVVLSFQSGQWVRFNPAHSDYEAIDPSKFDLSRLPMTEIPRNDYERIFKDLWTKNQACPDPGAYEVLQSDWLRTTDAERYGCHHYIIQAHDAWVEVLAKGWTWEYMRETRPYYNDPTFRRA